MRARATRAAFAALLTLIGSACRPPPETLLARDAGAPDQPQREGGNAEMGVEAGAVDGISATLRAQLFADVQAYLDAETAPDGADALPAKLDTTYADVDFALLAEAIRARPTKPTLPAAGTHEVSWPNPFTKKNQSYTLYVPQAVASSAQASAQDRFPLILFLHGAGGNGPGVIADGEIRAVADARGALLVAPSNPDQSCDWSALEECMSQVVRLTQLLKRRYPVDDRRVILTGFSMGGRGSFSVGVAYPEPYCGVLPLAGTIGAVFDDPDLQLHKIYCCPHLQNAANLRLRYIAGDADFQLLLYQNRGCALCIPESKAEHEYVEVAGAGHVFFHQRFRDAVDWMLAKPRVDYPKTLRFNLAAQASGIVPGGIYLHEKLAVPQYWAVPTGRRDTAKAGGLEATIAGQTVTVTTTNLRGVTIYLADELVDLDKAVTVVVDGKTVHDGVFQRDRRLALEQARLRSERSMVFAAEVTTTLPPSGDP